MPLKYIPYMAIIIIFASLHMPYAYGQTNITAPADISGYWISAKKDVVVRITSCPSSQEPCGYIHWIAPDKPQYDSANPAPDLRERPLCDVQVLSDFTISKDQSSWESGEIYQARKGEFFSADLRLTAPDKLKLRGYVALPLFGKSYFFDRVSPHDYPTCIKQ